MRDLHRMHLASLYVCFDLDPSIAPIDKERLLLSLREKLKQKFKNKLTIRMDEQESSIVIAFLDHNYKKIESYLHHILEHLEASSEARIGFHHEQIFSWFNGQFIDTSQQNLFDEPIKKKKSSSVHRSNESPNYREKTIVYTDNDEDDITPISTRFTRRNLRLPTRK